MGSLLAWLRSHPKITISVAAGALLWVVHAFLGWIAERDWRQYCKEARARGVILTFAELEQGDIPEAQNFAALPMFQQAVASAGGVATFVFDLPRTPSGAPLLREDRVKRQGFDWLAYQRLFKEAGFISELTEDPIADVLRGLGRYAEPVAEWRQGRERRYCHFPNPTPKNLERPSGLRTLLVRANKFFGLRMHAHLARSESPAALGDFDDAFQTYHALRDAPTLINGLIRMGLVFMVCSDVGDGLAAHAWRETELQALEATLASVRIGNDYRFAVSSERLFLNAFTEDLISCGPVERAQKVHAFFGWVTGSSATSFPISVRKLRRNQLRSNKYLDELAARISTDGMSFDVSGNTPSAPSANPSFLESWQYGLFHQSAAGITGSEANALRIAAMVAQTRIAIALERFRLARGSFPETLEEVVPAFLPAPLLDPWTGQPMDYHRVPPDSFLLYAVGKNRADDGGVIDRRKSAYEQRDAIWLYAPP